VPRGRESGGCKQDQENPYRLMQVFGRGHQVSCNGATVYVTQMSGDGGPPKDSHQQRDERVRGLDQLPDQSGGGIGEVQ
jgi:hypothetical protein